MFNLSSSSQQKPRPETGAPCALHLSTQSPAPSPAKPLTTALHARDGNTVQGAHGTGRPRSSFAAVSAAHWIPGHHPLFSYAWSLSFGHLTACFCQCPPNIRFIQQGERPMPEAPSMAIVPREPPRHRAPHSCFPTYFVPLKITSHAQSHANE